MSRSELFERILREGSRVYSSRLFDRVLREAISEVSGVAGSTSKAITPAPKIEGSSLNLQSQSNQNQENKQQYPEKKKEWSPKLIAYNYNQYNQNKLQKTYTTKDVEDSTLGWV